MVSTRQMAIVSGGSTDVSGQALDNGPARYTRNSVALHGLDVGSGEPQPSTSTALALPQKQSKKLMDLPPEIVDKILSYLPFKKICASRLVCKEMDRRCGHILNSTFARLQTQMYNRFQEIKSKMPRRESARRNHHLACESDIIETLHMRLTLLQMTFGKHIERRHCCFFPGDILDEVFNILHYIKVTNKLQRPYKVTDELFDLSTMAMEYFKEKIEPDLPEIAYFSTEFFDFATGTYGGGSNKYLAIDSSPLGADGKDGGSGNSVGGRGNGVGLDSLDDDIGDGAGTSTSHESTLQSAVAVVPLPPPPPPPQANMVLRKRIRKIKQGMKRYNSQLTVLTHDLRACKRKMTEQQRQIADQQKQLAEQQKQTLEYVTRLDENDKKNDEISRKFSTLLQELNKCKTELQYWRSKSPATPPFCTGCGNIIETPPEELRALLNQGVIPEGLEPLAQDELCEFRNLATPSTSNVGGGSSAIIQHPIPPTPAATPSCSKTGSPQHLMHLFEPAIQCTPLAAPAASSSAAVAVAMFGNVEAASSAICAAAGCFDTPESDGGSVLVCGIGEGSAASGMMAYKPGKRKLDMDGSSAAAMSSCSSSSTAVASCHIGGGKKARRSKRGKL